MEKMSSKITVGSTGLANCDLFFLMGRVPADLIAKLMELFHRSQKLFGSLLTQSASKQNFMKKLQRAPHRLYFSPFFLGDLSQRFI
ncbi:hypothetical protein A3710_22325 [Stutzerimonas frequens]|nr:hypothetical protein A3710_22325 [Stutzerimonas frequens]